MPEHLITTNGNPDKERTIGHKGAEKHEVYKSPTEDSTVEPSLPTKSTVKKEPSKTQKALTGALAATVLTAGAVQAAESATDSEIDPVDQTQEANIQSPEELHIEGVEVGDGLVVLNQTLRFSTDKVNVRTSPMVENNPEDSNLADTPDKRMPGSQNITVLHAIVVEDDINPSNGRWFGFADKDGKLYWVNENALTQSGYQVEPSTSEVVVAEVNTNGIIAKPQSDPQNGPETTVGTVVKD